MNHDIQLWTKLAAYGGGAICIGFGAVGAALGEGLAAGQANKAISRNPELSGEIFKTMLLGQAVTESAAIFALLITLILLFVNPGGESFLTPWALFSAAICSGIGAIGSGVAAGFPAGEACKGISRQPAIADKINVTMLIGTAVCQTPSIFALVISFILIYTDFSTSPLWPTWAAIFGAALSTGLGTIGCSIGCGIAGYAGCEGVARQPGTAGFTTKSMLLGQAIAQTTSIYGLLIGFILLFKPYDASQGIAPAVALLSAGICMGLGAIGPGIGEGITAHHAVKWISRREESIPAVTRTMLVGMAVAESTGIYSMVIALILIFVI